MKACRTILCGSLLLLFVITGWSPASAQEQLRWKFTPGQKFAHNMTQDTKLTMLAGAQPLETTMEQVIEGTWTVNELDDQGHAHITQTIDRIRMKAQGPMGVGMNIDTSDEQPPAGVAAAILPALKAMTNAKFDVVVNPQGEVLEVAVPNEVLQEFQKLPQMGSMFSKEGFENLIKQGTPAFPAESVTEGSSWTKSFDVKMPPSGTMVVANKFTYAGQEQVEGKTLDKINITMDMQIKQDQNAAPAVGVMSIKDQNSSGVIYFDNEAGRMVRSWLNQNMTMQVGSGNQTFSQKINQVIEVTLTPAE